MLDIHRLKLFVKVAELKSFSKAAHACFLTQPTVSQHVAALEEYLGLPLLDRMGREIRLTRAGEILFEYAKQIDRLSEEAVQSLENYKGQKGGKLEIAASTIPGEYVLPDVLGRFKEEYPGLRCTIHISDTDEAISSLEYRRVDLAIVGAKVKADGLTFTRFMDDELVLIVPSGHRWEKRKTVSVADLLTEPFVMRESGSGTRMVLGKILRDMSIKPESLNISTIVGSTTAVKEAVRSGLGISLVSKFSVVKDVSHGLLHALKIKDVKFERPFYIVTDRRTLSPVCSAFIQYLKIKKICMDHKVC